MNPGRLALEATLFTTELPHLMKQEVNWLSQPSFFPRARTGEGLSQSKSKAEIWGQFRCPEAF